MPDAQKIRVLVVDDEPLVVRLVQAHFADLSTHTVVVKSCAKEGLAEIVRGEVDILVTDLNMPEMDGYTLMRKARDYDPLLPMIALTGQGGPFEYPSPNALPLPTLDIPEEDQVAEVQIRCLEAGARYFISKPYHFKTLLAAVDALFASSRIERERQRLLLDIGEYRDVLQSIIDNTTDIVSVKTLDGRYVLINDAFKRRLSVNDKVIIGQTDNDLFSAEIAPRLRLLDRRVRYAAELIEGEEEFSFGGEARWYSYKAFPLYDAQGQRWAICLMAREITVEKRQSEELELLSRFPKVNPNIIIRIDSAQNVTYFNPRAQRWLEEHDFRSEQKLRLLFPPDITKYIEQTTAQTTVIETETTFQDAYYNFKLGAFEGIKEYLVTIADITELKTISLDREIYFQAFQHAIHPVMITDLDGIVLHLNHAFASFYEYAETEVLGKTPAILNPGIDIYHDLGINEEAYFEIFSGMWRDIKDPEKGHWEGEIPNRKKRGGLAWVRLYIDAIRDSSGGIIGYVAISVDVTEQRSRELNIRLECYRAIAELAERRDLETGAHLRRISGYVGLLAKYMGQPAKYIEDMAVFAPLHDIGKVGIPDNILLAPRKLTDAEMGMMKTHTTIGYEILKNRPTLEMAAEIAHSHHERWDGSGYPRQLSGEEIPLAARIVSVADVYDALRNERPYKKAWSHADAAAAIHSGTGTQFDPGIVKAFASLERGFNLISSGPLGG